MEKERGRNEAGNPAAVHRLKTGKLSDAVLERSIDKRLAGVRRTTAAREPGEPLVMQDAVTLNPFFEATPASAGILIRIAFCRMQNRFAARGALMKTIAVSLLLPENTAEETLRGMMDELAALCREYDIAVADGHTEVSAAVRQPVVSFTGIGFMRGALRDKERPAAGRDGEPGDCRAALPVLPSGGGLHGGHCEAERKSGKFSGMIVGKSAREKAEEIAEENVGERLSAVFMTGYAGGAGAGLLAALAGENAFPEKKSRQSGRHFSEALLESARAGLEAKRLLSLREAQLLLELESAEPYAALLSGGRGCPHREQTSGMFPLYLRAMGYGGVCTALWKLAEDLRCGLTADRKKILIRQETVELANFYQLDPYRMDSTGCLLGTAPCGRAEEIVRCLEENGVPARVIGMLTDSGDRLLVNDGETQYLSMPQGDALEALCPHALRRGGEYGGEHV